MNWKFWESDKKEPPSPLLNYWEWKSEIRAKAAQDAAQKQSGWDALSDYQKAARLEYRALQGLRHGRIVPEPVIEFGEGWSRRNNRMIQTFVLADS